MAARSFNFRRHYVSLTIYNVHREVSFLGLSRKLTFTYEFAKLRFVKAGPLQFYDMISVPSKLPSCIQDFALRKTVGKTEYKERMARSEEETCAETASTGE